MGRTHFGIISSGEPRRDRQARAQNAYAPCASASGWPDMPPSKVWPSGRSDRMLLAVKVLRMCTICARWWQQQADQGLKSGMQRSARAKRREEKKRVGGDFVGEGRLTPSNVVSQLSEQVRAGVTSIRLGISREVERQVQQGDEYRGTIRAPEWRGPTGMALVRWSVQIPCVEDKPHGAPLLASPSSLSARRWPTTS